MRFAQSGYILIAAFVFSVSSVGCEELKQSHQSRRVNSAGSDNLDRTLKEGTRHPKSIPIYLAVGSFDPLRQDSPVSLSRELTLQNYAENEMGYYILQFKDTVLNQWKERLIAAGVTFFDYIPEYAYLVKMDHQTRKIITGMAPVRWMGIYQPGYRIAPDLLRSLSARGNEPVEVLVSIFRGENVNAFRSKLDQLKGEILSVSKSRLRIKLRIPGYYLGALCRLTGIKFIAKVPEFKFSPGVTVKDN